MQCDSFSYDIIFLDHMMPGFDGVQTLKKIRELQNGLYQDLPVIALTANTVSGAREMFRGEGFTEFVPKPIERTVLERVLRRVLPKRFIQYSEGPGEENPPMEEQAQAVPVQAPEAGSEPAGETQAPADGPAAPYDRLAQAGVDVEMGLNYCCGDEDFFKDMLRMFRDQSGDKKAEIISLYEAANWADYAVKVHALKSTSLTIGAQALSSQAKELELAGKRGDADFIREHHAALMRAYDELCGQLAGI